MSRIRFINSSRASLTVALVVSATARHASAADAPPGYSILKTTAAGRALAVKKNKPTNVRDAIEAVLDDLDDYFDDDYDVYGAAENAKDRTSGFCTIKAKYHGKAVQGMVMTRLTNGGSVAVVIFCNADAPASAWGELTGTAAGPTAGPAQRAAPTGNPLDTTGAAAAPGGNPLDPSSQRPPQPGLSATPSATPPGMQQTPQPQQPPQQIRLTEYRFPDNTGSVGVADGWKCNSPGGAGIKIEGPAGQNVLLGFSASVNTPNSQAVQLARQYPVAGQQMLVAAYDDPASALATLTSQFSRLSVAKGGPAIEADNVRIVQNLPPQTQGSKWALVQYGLTRTTNGRAEHLQAMAQVGMIPIGSNEAWMIYITGCSAPDATAAVDGPVMKAIIGSWRTNDAQIQQNTQNWTANQNAWFAAQQAGHQAQNDAFDQHNAQWRADQNTQSRAMDDYSETLRGVRDIQDTRTGELTPANLGHVDDIIANLNAQDPGRYKALPLKDKLDPTPAGR